MLEEISRDRRLVQGDESRRRLSDGAFLLRDGADGDARHVDEVEDRHAKRLAVRQVVSARRGPTSGTHQRSMWRLILRAAWAVSVPPETLQSLLTTPTGWPSSLAKPTTALAPHERPISNQDRSSTTRSTMRRTSYARVLRRGMMESSSSERRDGAS